MNVLEAMSLALAELLRDDPRRVLLGEDVTTGGMLGWSRTCASNDALRTRLIALPLLPASMAAHAGGLALAGLRPIVLLPSAAALLEGLAGLREIGLVGVRSGGERTAPVLFVAPCGPGLGLGDDASFAPEVVLARTPGIRVFVVGRAGDAVRRLVEAAAFGEAEEPTVLLIPRLLLGSSVDADAAAPSTEVLAPTGRLRSGRTLVVFTWGEALGAVLEVCDDTELDATVIEVARLCPLDRDAIVEAARDTGRVAIVHAGGRAHGLGAEISALVAEHAIHYLDAPVLRVCGDDGPHAGADELRSLPARQRLAEALRELATP